MFRSSPYKNKTNNPENATNTSYSLPKNVNYFYAFKTAWLIAIRSTPQTGRDDHWIQNVICSENVSGTYELQAHCNEDPSAKSRKVENFEDFITKNEITLGEKSEFYKICEHLNTSPKIDKYIIANCALMFLDNIIKNIKAFQSDKDLMTELQEKSVRPKSWLKTLTNMCIWYLRAYSMEKFSHSISEKQETHNYDALIKQAQIGHAIDTMRSIYNEVSITTIDINDYAGQVKFNISLGVSPAITDGQKDKQRAIYGKAVQARESAPNFSDSEEFRRSSVAQQLMLDEDQQPHDFICNDHEFLESAFNLPNLTARTSAKDILNHFYISNIGFLIQIDKIHCNEEIYMLALQRLWNEFAHDSRCPRIIKDRRADIRKEINLNNEWLVHANNIRAISNNIATNLDEKTRESFSEFLSKTAYQNEILSILLNMLPTNDEGFFNEQCVFDSISYTFIIDCINEKLDRLTPDCAIDAQIIRYILEGNISLNDKLNLIGNFIQAKTKNKVSLNKNLGGFYNALSAFAYTKDLEKFMQIFTSFLKARVSIDDSLSTIAEMVTTLPLLLSSYETEKKKKTATSTSITQHEKSDQSSSEKNEKRVTKESVLSFLIKGKCNSRDLLALKETLRKVRATADKWPGLFSPYEYCVFEDVLLKIEGGDSVADILVALKQLAKQEVNESPEASEICTIINKFFSSKESDDFINDSRLTQEKTMSLLLNCVSEAVNKSTAESEKTNDVHFKY